MKKFICGLLGLLVIGTPAFALDVPVLKGRVNDYANVLTPQQSADLEARLKQEETESSNQIVILIIPSLKGDDLKQFANDTFVSWGIGQKGKDNGILILQSVVDRKIRIEVGKGLEGRLTDAQSADIIRNTIVPKFKSNQFFEGYVGGISEIVRTVKGEFAPKPVEIPISDNQVQMIVLVSVLGVIGFILLLVYWFRPREDLDEPDEVRTPRDSSTPPYLPPIESHHVQIHRRHEEVSLSHLVPFSPSEDPSPSSSVEDSISSSPSRNDDDTFTPGGGDSGGGGSESSY